MATTARKFKGAAPVKESSTDPNERFAILRYTCRGESALESHYTVYLLNPGDHFAGFGGSRHGLSVTKKASLIVRRVDAGMHDTEYDLADKDAWRYIHIGLTLGLVRAARVACDELESAQADTVYSSSGNEAGIAVALKLLADAVNAVPVGDG